MLLTLHSTKWLVTKFCVLVSFSGRFAPVLATPNPRAQKHITTFDCGLRDERRMFIVSQYWRAFAHIGLTTNFGIAHLRFTVDSRGLRSSRSTLPWFSLPALLCSSRMSPSFVPNNKQLAQSPSHARFAADRVH